METFYLFWWGKVLSLNMIFVKHSGSNSDCRLVKYHQDNHFLFFARQKIKNILESKYFITSRPSSEKRWLMANNINIELDIIPPRYKKKIFSVQNILSSSSENRSGVQPAVKTLDPQTLTLAFC